MNEEVRTAEAILAAIKRKRGIEKLSEAAPLLAEIDQRRSPR